MLAILNPLNALNLPIFQPILMILVSKFMVNRVLSGLLSPLIDMIPELSSKYSPFLVSGQQNILSKF